MKSRTNSQKRKSEQREGKEEKVRESQKKEDACARLGRKVAKRGVLPMFCGSGRSKSRLTEAAGAEPAGQVRD